MHSWFVYKEFAQASAAAADFLARKIKTSIQHRGECHVILPGGNSPAQCLIHLAEKDLPWNQVQWYLGDERCYPLNHADRNDVMLEKNLWSHLSLPNIHRIPTEFGAEQAAKIYRGVINSIECFDVAFIGMGEDGHTASLFPDNVALQDTRSVIPVYDSPKLPAERVSLSVSTLKKARCRMLLTGGTEKAEVIAKIKQGEALPVNSIGNIHWFVDEAAMSQSV